eukprot:tig00001126_g7124.t1
MAYGTDTLFSVSRAIPVTRQALQNLSVLDEDTRFQLSRATTEAVQLLRRVLASSGPSCNYIELDFEGNSEHAQAVCEAAALMRHARALKLCEVSLAASALAAALGGAATSLFLYRVAVAGEGQAELLARLDEIQVETLSLQESDCPVALSGRRQKEPSESWFGQLVGRGAAVARKLVVKNCKGLTDGAVRALAGVLRGPHRLEEVHLSGAPGVSSAAWADLQHAVAALRGAGHRPPPPEIRVEGRRLEEGTALPPAGPSKRPRSSLEGADPHEDSDGTSAPAAARAPPRPRPTPAPRGPTPPPEAPAGSSSAPVPSAGPSATRKAATTPVADERVPAAPPPTAAEQPSGQGEESPAGKGAGGRRLPPADAGSHAQTEPRKARRAGAPEQRQRARGGGAMMLLAEAVCAERGGSEASASSSDDEEGPQGTLLWLRRLHSDAPPVPLWLPLRGEGAAAAATLPALLAAASALFEEKVVELWDARLNGVQSATDALAAPPGTAFYAATPRDLASH